MNYFNTYRKKTVEIEAFQLTEHVFDMKILHCRDVTDNYSEGYTHTRETINNRDINYYHYKNGVKLAFIDTLEGTMRANIDDWIIKGINGEIYPCKPDIFEKTYEKIINLNEK